MVESRARSVLLPLVWASLGAVAGIASKASDGGLLGEITSGIGIWIFVGALIVRFSPSVAQAAMRSGAFFVAMVLAYYVYSATVLGFVSRSQLLAWSIVALLSPLIGVLFWVNWSQRWVSTLAAALPIGLLLSHGYTFRYNHRPPQAAELLMALALLVLPWQGWRRLAAIVPVAIVVAWFAFRFEVLGHLPWS